MTNLVKKLQESDEVRWLAFFILLIFPMLGNAISYGWFDSRRPLQLSFLAIGFIFLLLSIKKKDIFPYLDKAKNTFWMTLSVGSLSFFYLYFSTEDFGVLSFSSWQKYFFNFSYLFLFILLALVFRNRKNDIKTFLGKGNDSPRNSFVAGFVVLLGGIIFFKAWWIGPMELQAHIDFGGSTTIVGLCSTTAFFAILFGLPANGLVRFGASLPFMYLLFFSTSRTAYVVFLTLWIVFLLRAFFVRRSPEDKWRNGKRLVAAMIPILALLTILAPLRLSSRFYPFFVSTSTQENIWTYNGRSAKMEKVGAERLIVYRQEELWNRLSRFFRALYSFYQSPIVTDFREWINDVFDAKIMPDLVIPVDDFQLLDGYDPSERWKRLAYHSAQGESRVQIIRKTNQLIKERPQGWWPSIYGETIDFYCNEGQKCLYPHNIVLEATFYFGFIVGLLYLFLMGYLSWVFLKFCIFGNNCFLTGLSAAIIIHFFGAQFTGTYYDLTVTAFLLIVFVIFLGKELNQMGDRRPA